MHVLAALDVNVQNDAWSIAVAVATIVAALGTVGAIIVALFLPGWQAKRTRPKLTVRAEERTFGTGYRVVSAVSDEPADVLDGPALIISNEPGRDTAHRVEVLLTVYENGTRFTVPPLTMRLLADRPLNFGSNDGTYGSRVVNVGPGASRRVFYMRIGDPRRIFETWYLAPDAQPPSVETVGPHFVNACAAWATVPARQDELSYLVSGVPYFVELLVTGDNFDALRYRGRVRIDSVTSGPGTYARTASVNWIDQLTPVRDRSDTGWPPWDKAGGSGVAVSS